QVSITDDGGSTTSTASTALVEGPWAFISAAAVTGADPQAGFLRPIGEANVDLYQGALRLSQALDFDQSPGTSVGGSPALLYNSATVNVRPVVQLEVQTNPFGAAPVQAQLQLTWNGVAQTPVTIPLSVQPGQPV